MKDKISLAGDLGSGKSTVSKIIIESLGAEYYSTGAIVRGVAEKHGMTVVELNKYMETHPEIDHEIDDGLKALSDVDKLLIIDSRMAWHFTKGTFKVYLTIDIETGALRIMNANRDGEHRATLEETVKDTRDRRESEKLRYKEQYGVDIKDLSNYALIVDTTYATPDEIAEIIMSGFEQWRGDRDYARTFICPSRLNFIDDEADAPEVEKRASMLDEGLEIPEVTVFECDGEFYVEDGLESALAYAFNMATFIPSTLIDKKRGDEEYIRMQNSL